MTKVLGSRWEIKEELGVGSFSHIYKALDLQTQKMVAIKMEKPTPTRKVLCWETKVLLKLQGNRFFPEYIAHDSLKKFYIVMELLGEDLSHHIKSKGKLGWKQTSLLGVEMLRCIKCLHECGFLHRDIKPANFVFILNKQHDDDDEIGLIDFGLVREFRKSDGTLHRPRNKCHFVGSSKYASLNSHSQMELGRRDDLWSFVFSLIEMARGLPWAHGAKSEVVAKKKEFLSNPDEIPPQILSIIDHLNSLTFFCCPDYAMIISQLKQLSKPSTTKPDHKITPPPPPPPPPIVNVKSNEDKKRKSNYDQKKSNKRRPCE